MDKLILIIQLLCCFSLFGLIWTIQLVHYPAYIYVKEEEFSDFSFMHNEKISFFVAPLMIIDLFSGAILMLVHTDIFSIINFIGILCTWLFTFLLSVPCHKRLLKEKDVSVIKKLIITNWPRTLTWTLRGILLFYMSVRSFVL
jgi:hypothetical protein